ncbi:MAG: hypothetical protein ABF332_05885 [Akkermansiaceae bacterium]
MKIFPIILAGLSTTLHIFGQTTVTLYEEDFESEGVNLNEGNNGASRTLVPDPEAGGVQGQVAAIDISGGNEWGELNATPNPVIALPAATEAGVSEFTVKLKVYVPSDTTFATGASGPDRVGLIIRWNNLQPSGVSQFTDWDLITPDTWEELTLTGIVPAVDTEGNAVTRARPILSFHDRDEGAAGTAVYIDDFSIEVGVSEDDPNFSHLSDLSFGQIDQNGGPIDRVIPLTNAGETETLTITEINLGGLNANFFAISDLSLPLDIAPGESVDLVVTVDPGETLGFLSANVGFVTNDPTTPNLTTIISAESVEPFVGKELIINGDFETANFEGWRQNDRFNPTTDQSRSGDTAGVYNLAGENQWGEARVAQFDNEVPDSIPITPEMIGKTFEYTAWYYWPSENGMAPNDSIMTIFRWNAINTGNTTLGRNNQLEGLPRDTWFRVRGTAEIPATGGDGEPTTGVTILWSFRDVDADAAGGELMYIDDVSFKVDVPFDLPPFELKIMNLAHDTENDIVTFDYTARPGTTYAVDRSTGLNEVGQPDGWIEISDSELADEDVETFIDNGAPSGGAKYFYRVRVAE